MLQKWNGKNSGEIPLNNSFLEKLIAFSCGTLLGDVFLHMIPHLLEELSHHHHDHS
jgi:zinc transporter 7